MAEPQWDMGGTITSIVIFLLMTASSLTLWKRYKNRKLARRKCKRLKFDDLPVGRIHDCRATYLGCCDHTLRHEVAPECWASRASLGEVFDRAWRLAQKRPASVPIPAAWPEVPTLATDVATVMAFILCTVPADEVGRKDLRPERWHRLSFGTLKVLLYSGKGLDFVHLQGVMQPERCGISKAELSGMLHFGYPPWYREVFHTRARNATPLPFPISDPTDVPRGGWIVAVGLMDLKRAGQAPLPLYCCRGEPENPPFRGNARMYREAVTRCRDHIKQNILPRFPDDANVQAAVEALDYLVKKRTQSGVPTRGDFGPNWSDSRPMPHMTYAQCHFILGNFNAYRPLTDADAARFEAILLPVMAAAVHGAVEVVRYLKDVGLELRLPVGLDLDDEVFLKGCANLHLF